MFDADLLIVLAGFFAPPLLGALVVLVKHAVLVKFGKNTYGYGK